jgi:predicted acyltransferase
MALETERDAGLDRARGAAIILMAIVNSLSAWAWVPPWLKHAPGAGFTLADAVMPAFVVYMAMGLAHSRSGRGASPPGTRKGLLKRSLALIGLGTILSALQGAMALEADGVRWGVLQTLGFCSLAMAAFIGLPPAARAVLGLAFVLANQSVLWARGYASPQNPYVRAGIESLSWAGLYLLSNGVFELIGAGGGRKTKRLAAVGSAACALGLAGGLLALAIPVSKSQATLPFMLVGAGIAFAAYGLLSVPGDARIGRLLASCGRNPLSLYLLHYLLLPFFLFVPLAAWCPADLPLLSLGPVLALIALLSVSAWTMERRGIHFSL